MHPRVTIETRNKQNVLNSNTWSIVDLAGFKRSSPLLTLNQTMSHIGKHFVNDPATLVQESLRGLELLNPEIRVNMKHKGTLPSINDCPSPERI